MVLFILLTWISGSISSAVMAEMLFCIFSVPVQINISESNTQDTEPLRLIGAGKLY